MNPVHKFDGGCLTDVPSIQRAVLRVNEGPAVVVCSALFGATETLEALIETAQSGDPTGVQAAQDTFVARHRQIADAVGASQDELTTVIEPVGMLLAAVAQTRLVDPRLRARIVAAGEKLAGCLLAGALKALGRTTVIHPADALLSSEGAYLSATPLPTVARRTLQAALATDQKEGRVSIVPGSIGQGPHGATARFGPSGADITAMLVAEAVDAAEVILWTDADGLLTGDPTVIDDVTVIEHLHYREATEMSFYGTRQLHPRAMIPAQSAGLSVMIRNIAEPNRSGTVIDGRFSRSERPVKAVTAIHGQALLSVEGKGMAGVTGLSGRIFTALADAGVSATMISQAGSESSICLAVDKRVAERGASAVRRALQTELSRAEIEEVAVRRQADLVAVIGRGMAQQPGVAAATMQALADAEINILALAQGSSELNITVAVDARDRAEALRQLHRTFRLHEGRRPIVVPLKAVAATPPALRVEASSSTVSRTTDAHQPLTSEVGAVTAFAPATVANLGLGFDILGLALGS
ncbi:MAG: aspartate kinase, partial [Myxococcota bacterium]